MSDIKRMEAALQAAADAGDTAAAQQIASEMRRMLQQTNPSLGTPEPLKLGQAAMPSMVRGSVRAESRPEQAYAGAGAALALAGHGLNQLTMPAAPVVQNWKGLAGPDASVPNTQQNDIENWRSLIKASPDTIGGNILGNAMLFGAMPTRMGMEMTAGRAPWIAGRTGTVVDTAATGMAQNYALTPGGAPERLREAALAGVLAPIAPALYAAGAGSRRALTRGGKQVAVGEGVLAESGPNAENIITSLRGVDPGAPIGVASSSAMKTGIPVLETLESGARAKRGDLWRDFDRGNAKARWDALVSRAGTPEELDGMKSGLNAKTSELREQALSDAQLSTIFSQSGDVTKPMLKPMTDKIADWRMRHRPNRDVQTLANYIEGEIKQGVTPEQLYEIRKTLTDGIKGGRTDELSNAVKSARVQRMEAIGMIDDALNTLSGGGWREYMTKHSSGMRPIESKQALQDVVSSLERGMPTGVIPPAMGESPAWKTVGNLRDRFGQKELGSKTVDTLLPEDRQLLNNIVDSLKRQSDTMQAKGVLGSHTGALLANMGRAEGVTRNIVDGGINRVLPFGSVLSSKVFDKLGRQAEEELARLLQDPNALADAIAAAIRARGVQKGASKVGAGIGAAYE
jgi:hypothetical protein